MSKRDKKIAQIWKDAEKDDDLMERREVHEKKVRRQKKKEDIVAEIKAKLEEDEKSDTVKRLEGVIKQKVEVAQKEEEAKMQQEMSRKKKVSDKVLQKVCEEAEERSQGR